MLEINKIHHGDCLELMPRIQEKSVDLILTSPPYKVGKKYDESINLETFLLSAFKTLKNNGVFAWQTGNRIRDGFIIPLDIITFDIFMDNGFSMINRVVWTFGHGAHCKNRFSGRYEMISLYAKTKLHTFNLDAVRVAQKYPNKKHYKGPKKGELSGNPKGKNPGDVWDITNVKNNHPEKTDHPCQFPQELCNRIIKAFSNSYDIVLDPFVGSGTAIVEAIKADRKYIGIDNDIKSIDIANQRIKNVEPELF